MKNTLRKHLETELRVSSVSKNFQGNDGHFLGVSKLVRNSTRENFELKYGLIAPVTETVNRLIVEYYTNKGYSQKDTPSDGFRGGGRMILGPIFDIHNYLFIKGDSEVIVRMTPLSSQEGLLVSVFSALKFADFEGLFEDVEQRQN